MTTPQPDPPQPSPLPSDPNLPMPSPVPEGLAFDVEPGTDLTGVPVGDQTPRNPDAEHIEETVRETGTSIGLAIPHNRHVQLSGPAA
jgi:hypothetical protein